jgi:hypothetical protein
MGMAKDANVAPHFERRQEGVLKRAGGKNERRKGGPRLQLQLKLVDRDR